MTGEKVDHILEGDEAWKEAELGESEAFKAAVESVDYGYCATTAAWHWFHIGYYAGNTK